MRLVFDLQACQTESSRQRGIGRFSQALATHVARLNRLKGLCDLRFCCNGNYPDTIGDILNKLDPYISRQNITEYRYPAVRRKYLGERSTRVYVAEAIVKQHWISLQPEVLHIPHIFEGLIGEAVVPHRLPKIQGLIRSATLHDLIPLRFPDKYLVDPRFKQWYFEKLGTLQECDLLLAISDSSKKDAIELLNIHPDRVVTIWEGADRHFRPQQLAAEELIAFRDKFKLRGRFVLYAGGDDYRKNIEGTIAAFSLLPGKTRRDVQLVIVCSIQPERRAMYLTKVEKYGLNKDDVIFVGFVSEKDLVTFYNLCDAFLFPSLYEGFGLPILEAMSCGAPVIGSNNSAIREIIGRSDATFDAHSSESIARLLFKVLSDKGLQNDLRLYGLQRAKEFSWERSAQLALDAFQDVYTRLSSKSSISLTSVLPRKGLAIFSPLPPCRSGIADYNAAFLPFLAKYFDIELFVDDYEVSDPYIKANFPIRSHNDFPKLAGSYDAVLYDMGGSEFHAYMLNYLERFPGIVVLHDAYLSGLYGYMDFYLGQSGRYSGEMIYSHGTRARRFFAPVQGECDPVMKSMIDLPCTRRVIERATGIISHSPFNLKVAHENYPEGWVAPYRVIKQMVRIPAIVGREDKRRYRLELGFEEKDLILCTFGHVAWTKCGDLLLEAFLKSSLSSNPRVKLVFAGELARDDFGYGLERTMKNSALKERIRITGYLTESDYSKYLAITNLAVQLRKNSRGGTPKGVLDCLANGVPVIVNNDASYTDYPDDVVLKISPDPCLAELVEALDRWCEARSKLDDVRTAGREYVEREHHPEKIAEQYASIIHEFIERQKAVSLPTRIEEIGGAIARGDHSDHIVDESAEVLFHSLSRALFRKQRILLDVSHIADLDYDTGIQRVVRNIVRWLYCSKRADYKPLAVRLTEDGIVEATEWLEDNGLLLASERNAEQSHQKINLEFGDILLMLDSSWARIDEFLPMFEKVREIHGKVYTVIYDVLPIILPQYFVPGGPEWFRGWLEKAIDHSDGLICISRAVADEVCRFVQLKEDGAPTIPIGYWHLGGDLGKDLKNSSPASNRVGQALSGQSFLMVGTIEPRKGHALTLDAMEILWRSGCDVGLCIAGKKGWMVDELIERISRHPELGNKLHFIDRPTDEELQYLYRHSVALIFPSAGEGFGLPLIEAARFGTPVLASDIPVLREIGGEHVTYFPLGSSHGLARCLEEWLTNAKDANIPDSNNIRWLTWEQSASQLLDVILDNRWYKLPLEED